ncbi:MAG: hypothetical protein OET18_18165 [Desulfobacterales bacterium]|nr:hypothetical protein [Desulfobacterales bacterium]
MSADTGAIAALAVTVAVLTGRIADTGATDVIVATTGRASITAAITVTVGAATGAAVGMATAVATAVAAAAGIVTGEQQTRLTTA